MARAPGGWRVDDANGQAVAYVYGRDDQGVNGTMLTVDELRRIATNIAQLPELLRAGRRPATLLACATSTA